MQHGAEAGKALLEKEDGSVSMHVQQLGARSPTPLWLTSGLEANCWDSVSIGWRSHLSAAHGPRDQDKVGLTGDV